MRLSEREARVRFAGARVARLATIGPATEPQLTSVGPATEPQIATVDPAVGPHLVPITFAVTGNLVVHAVDHKPKETTNLRRLRNIAENNSVCILVDEYTDDWTQLWWVRADGWAEIRDRDTDAIDLLAAKYPQYADIRPSGPVVVVHVERWSGWSAA